uniref:Drebrin n=1 Tax=Scleropages formosus TaxID=113540 RepID=A0A8C9TDZ6_SCLFO
MAVNLSKNRLSLLTAYQDVISETSDTDWALYTYEGDSNDLTLAASGEGGLQEVSATFDSSCIMYGFCSLKEPTATLPRYVLINWVGEDVPDARKCACASHVATIAEFFQVSATKGVSVIINASSVDDIDPAAIGQRLTNGTAPVASPVLSRLRTRDEEQAENVGTRYQKTNAEIEMKKINREEFWEQAKREEEMRKEEERKKAAEERARFEEERMELERKEQEERERRYRERERQIEEHRERETACLCVRFPETNAASPQEAAAIIAQRTDNPREFFRQKEKAISSGLESSPISTHRTGSSERRADTLGPSTIPTIVTTPIQEEDDYPNEWDPEPEPEQHAPIQESTPAKPTQSVAPQARDMPSSPSPPVTDSLLDLWESSGPAPATAPSQATQLMDLMGDPVEACPADVSPALPQPLLCFDELPEPPSSFCQEDPSCRVDLAGPHEMTLSYQHALLQASGSDSQELDDGQLLMTNGDALLKEGTQASEGYFSQSQEEEFGQSEECSAKVTPTPVFYNKPPEIDITCWDTDPVLEDDD